MTKIKSQFKIVVSSNTENLAMIRNFVLDAAKRTSLNLDQLSHIELAVDEACTNAIEHAYKYNPDKNILIQVKIKDHDFVVEIIDRGINKFDPSAVEEVDLKEFVREKRTGGLGIHLIRTLMDEVHYFTGTGNYNRVTLVKKFA